MDPINRSGKYISYSMPGERYQAFVPYPLPPDPPLQFDSELLDLMEKANRSLGQLDGLTTLLPDLSLFIYLYIRKEALLSSQIEGTQSSLSDLLLSEIDEAPGVPLDDVQEVSTYVAAMNHGLARLQELPLSLRLIREIHEVLLSKGRGSDKTPGEFRRTQNWIGGTRPGNARFVPPPPENVLDCMSDLEKFLHNDPTPALIKAALAHAQFETIHPFLDGNGRIGRLLITFILYAQDVLSEPLLYLSLYFKTHREAYYENLQNVRLKGDWEGWLRFFLTGVTETAQQAASAAKSVLLLFEDERRQIEKLGRPANSALRVYQLLQRRPLVSIPAAAKELGLSAPTIAASLENLRQLGIVSERTGKQRNRLFRYDRYLEILNQGTEPLPR